MQFQKSNDESHAALQSLFISKIEGISCEDCFVSKRVDKVDEKINTIENRQYYLMGIGAAAIVVLQFLSSIFFK
jgi:hypothetical protein